MTTNMNDRSSIQLSRASRRCRRAAIALGAVLSALLTAQRAYGAGGATGAGIMVISCGAPPPLCPADITGDQQVNVNDLLSVINGWGACASPCPPNCAPDVTQDCLVNVNDLLAVINAWGPPVRRHTPSPFGRGLR